MTIRRNKLLMNSFGTLLVLALPGNLAADDAVADWNAITVQAMITAVPARPGPSGALDIAMVHAAVYDAVEAIDGRFKPYHVKVPGASGSPVVAAAKAAHDVLVNRFPPQAGSLDTAYHSYLSSKGLSEFDPGVGGGQQAAAGIIAMRANDGSFPNPPPIFIGGTNPGEWRPTTSYNPGPPPSLSPMAAPWLGNVTPFTMASSSQFRAVPPPALTSDRYVRDYNEVKALGNFFSSTRSKEQTDLGYFYSDNFLVILNRGVRDIAVAHVNNIGDSARLFALTSLAMADAVITAWDSKRLYFFWRPVTAIQEGDNDGNPRTVGDPKWTPLINTLPYPEYTSGANNVTAATMRMLQLFFETDHMTFTLNSTISAPPQVGPSTRTYHRFSDVPRDVVNVRIYQGIHFRSADNAGRSQGTEVAEQAFKHFFRSVRENHGDDDSHDGDHHDDGAGRH